MIDLAEVKRSVRLRDLLPADARVQGPPHRWRSACPIHGGERMSFSVDRREGYDLFTCFTCGAKGDVLSFVQELHHCDIRQAVEILGFEWKREKRRMSELERWELTERAPRREYPYPWVWCCPCGETASAERRRELPAGWAWAARQPWCLRCVRRAHGWGGAR